MAGKGQHQDGPVEMFILFNWASVNQTKMGVGKWIDGKDKSKIGLAGSARGKVTGTKK